jgi:hypothetical protein
LKPFVGDFLYFNGSGISSTITGNQQYLGIGGCRSGNFSTSDEIRHGHNHATVLQKVHAHGLVLGCEWNFPLGEIRMRSVDDAGPSGTNAPGYQNCRQRGGMDECFSHGNFQLSL